MAKSLLDYTVSLLVLLILSPVMIVVALVVRAKLGTPVIFRQQRPGLHGQPFWLYKFRTMTNSTDKNGNLLPEAERMHPVGNFLRRFSLDELPQLLNVLNGDLSLVGPRPLLMKYLPRYTKEQFRRHDVKPGITGWAQINGRNSLSWEEKFALDVWYVDHRTFGLDLLILFRTALKVFRADGVNQAADVTMSEFLGVAGGDRHEQM